jgi:hypothetical protein
VLRRGSDFSCEQGQAEEQLRLQVSRSWPSVRYARRAGSARYVGIRVWISSVAIRSSSRAMCEPRQR